MPTLKGEIKVVFHAVGPNYNNNLLFFLFCISILSYSISGD